MANQITPLDTQVQTVTLHTPDPAALLAEAENARSTADFLVIFDEESMKIATDELNIMSKRLKEIEKVRKSITGPLDAAKKNIMGLFKPATEKYAESIAIVKDGIARYTIEQEQKAAAARIEAERQAEAERKAFEEQAKQSDSPEQAEALLEAASMIVADAPAPVAKVKGVSTSKKWRGSVKDLAAFLRYAADHPELHGCVEVKQGALDRFIAATGGAIEIPGVEVSQSVIVSSRSAS